MPLCDPSDYRAPWWLPGGHLQTLAPALFGSREDPGYRRERMELADGDFLDLDWLRKGSENLALLIHGLEGASHSPYMVRMARALRTSDRPWDVVSVNLRGCSGERNRTARSYHSGETDDLEAILAKVSVPYRAIALVGFSLGGNIVLKYLGEAPDRVRPTVAVAVALSPPCHLASAAEVLARPVNGIYMRRFLRTLGAKIRDQARRFPGTVNLSGLESMHTFKAFDDRYTAPIHGFRDAEDYWNRCSSRQFLPAIRVPTLMLSARNDPFLSAECFPETEARKHPCLWLETPDQGGHLGFPGSNQGSPAWLERRTIRFLDTALPRHRPGGAPP